MRNFSRRSLMQASAIGAGLFGLGAFKPAAAQETNTNPILGKVIDFAAGVPNAADIQQGGYLGGVRYVSARRPGTENWMLGKPVTLKETVANAEKGLATASVYQYGRAETADWLNGASGATVHVPQAISFHQQAGGPTGVPIYMAIDDNPTRTQYTQQVLPYLQTCKKLLEAEGYVLGVYANYSTISWLIADGIGEYFWQHDWGSQGLIHPQANLHQKAGLQTKISGVTVDINNVYTSDWGQWTPAPCVIKDYIAKHGSLPASSYSN